MTRFLADPHCLDCGGRGYVLRNRGTDAVRLVAVPCRCRVLLPDVEADRPSAGASLIGE